MFRNDLTKHELNPCQNQTSNIMFFLLLQNQTSNYEKNPEIRMVKIFRFGASLKLLTTSTTPPAPYYMHVYCMFLILFGLEKWLFIDFTPKFWHFNVQGCCQTNGEVSKWKIPHIAVSPHPTHQTVELNSLNKSAMTKDLPLNI